MDRQFPPIVKQLVSSHAVKKAFISDIQTSNPNECHNCGGVGTLTLFLATKGPFQSSSASREDCNKWEEGVGWWVGQHHAVTCPQCDGLGIRLTGKNNVKADAQQIKQMFRQAAFDRGVGE